MFRYNTDMKLPENYLTEMKELFGAGFEDYLASFDVPAFSALRVNTSKISADDFLKISPFRLTPVPWTDDGFYYAKEDDPTRHPFYHAGLYYVQEPSAMAPASFLPVNPGDAVLDACAAPGGKSCAIASRLNGTGLLISNDLSFSRQNATLRNLERFGASNIYVTGENALDLETPFRNYFDKILLDAPCSGEGMFRKDPSLIRSYQSQGSSFYAPLQKELLEACVNMLKDGGTIVYSTCTFSRAENEEVLKDVMSCHPELALTGAPYQYSGFTEGTGEGMESCVRFYPHKLSGEGHFVSVLKKSGALSPAPSSRLRPALLNHKGFAGFMSHVFKDFTGYRFEFIKDRIYAIPDIDLPFKKMRILRSGLLMGTVKKDIFEPSQALAMALRKEEFDRTVSFDADDTRTMKYLRGETIFADTGQSGWVLVCVNGYPLGFAKGSGTTLKNKLDPSWRKL